MSTDLTERLPEETTPLPAPAEITGLRAFVARAGVRRATLIIVPLLLLLGGSVMWYGAADPATDDPAVTDNDDDTATAAKGLTEGAGGAVGEVDPQPEPAAAAPAPVAERPAAQPADHPGAEIDAPSETASGGSSPGCKLTAAGPPQGQPAGWTNDDFATYIDSGQRYVSAFCAVEAVRASVARQTDGTVGARMTLWDEHSARAHIQLRGLHDDSVASVDLDVLIARDERGWYPLRHGWQQSYCSRGLSGSKCV